MFYLIDSYNDLCLELVEEVLGENLVVFNFEPLFLEVLTALRLLRLALSVLIFSCST